MHGGGPWGPFVIMKWVPGGAFNSLERAYLWLPKGHISDTSASRIVITGKLYVVEARGRTLTWASCRKVIGADR